MPNGPEASGPGDQVQEQLVGGDQDPDEYAVPSDPPFLQVSPEASFWAEDVMLRTVRLDELIERLGGEDAIDEYERPPTQAERDELTTGEFSYDKRYDPIDQDRLGAFLTHPAFIARPPAGTTLNNRIMSGRLPIVRNGAELATMFEAEKTAVWHQHVYLTLLDLPGEFQGQTLRLREVISPVRQALMQAALHIATLSALTAAWRLKWRRTPTDAAKEERRVARRERPAEYFVREGTDFTALFDSEIRFDANGSILRDIEVRRRAPDPYPGTPRHPAYTSGHSTYSAAASEVMKVFLPPRWGMTNMPGGPIEDIPGQLDKLANSIGEARFWGGVHWRKDHEFGQKVGKEVANIVIDQLDRSLIDPKPSDFDDPPTREDLETLFKDTVGKADKDGVRWDWRTDGPFPRPAEAGRMNLQGGRV